ncbi:MAG: hypothetical protein EB084_18080 [Proteobacteria bacterium]|nr:hypothetical protein [Pseudomonadota bacterium]
MTFSRILSTPSPIWSTATASPTRNADRQHVVTSFIAESNSSEGRALKRRCIGEILTAQPQMDAPTLARIASFVNESNSIEGRRLKLESLQHIAQTAQPLEQAHVEALSTLVNESNGLEGRSLKLNAVATMFTKRPTLPPGVLRGTTTWVNDANGLPARRVRLESTLDLLNAYPDVSGEIFERAGNTTVGAPTTAEGLARLQTTIPELMAHARLAGRSATVAASPGAATTAGLSAALLERVEKDAAVILATAAKSTAEARLAHYNTALDGDRSTLLAMERELYEQTWKHCAEPVLGWVQVGSFAGTVIAGAALTHMLPMPVAIASVIQTTSFCAGLLVTPRIVGKQVAWLIPARVENSMRKTLEPLRGHWKERSNELTALREQATQSALLKEWNTAASDAARRTADAGTVTANGSEVVINGIRVERRTTA